MVVSLKPTLQILQGYLSASGWFPGGASIGEPLAAPGDMASAVFLARSEHPSTTLSGTIERRWVTIRIYRNALAEPRENIEFDLDTVVSQVQSDLLGDFDLGSTVRAIDVTSMSVEYGYQTFDTTIYRIADLQLPMIIDDSASFTA